MLIESVYYIVGYRISTWQDYSFILPHFYRAGLSWVGLWIYEVNLLYKYVLFSFDLLIYVIYYLWSEADAIA